MFDWLTYDHIKEFQSLIVGAFGFGGIILTLRQSAKLTREQHERGIQHERSLITRALLAELRRNRETLAYNLEKFGDLEEGSGVVMPTRTIAEIYEKNFDRITHLNEGELKDVLDAYSKIKAVPERIIFAQILLKRENFILNDKYLLVDQKFLPLYQTLLEKAVAAINKAIATLEAPQCQ
jgi:hypothetical protein